MRVAPWKADIFWLLEIATMAKLSEQPYTESCVECWRQALRSVDREFAGRNKVKRIISPEMDRGGDSRLFLSIRKAEKS